MNVKKTITILSLVVSLLDTVQNFLRSLKEEKNDQKTDL